MVERIKQKTRLHTRATTLWMRPEVWKALKVFAVQREMTVQDVIERAVCSTMGREDLLSEPAEPAAAS